tara:strand:+ start:900 stop:1913 length:1014 start_codon:yes stop_codon:yes gene_type:complete
MIKIKLSDPNDHKNFSALILAKDLLQDYSIQLTTSDDYDYEFIAQKDFLNLSVPLEQSISQGLDVLSKKTGDYFLFSGADSTSLLGAYEVFDQSNAKYLFKKQMLSRKDYREQTTLNKWFFGNGSNLDKGYDISETDYSKIKLTGHNVAHNWPQLQLMQQGNTNRDIDVCAVYQGSPQQPIFDHEVRSDILYANHRIGAWDELSKIESQYNIVKGTSTSQQFVEIMGRSKIGLSPFGMGELCYRDLELIQWGCLLIKPDMSKVITKPDFFKPWETYVPVKPDWSDLNEVIEMVLTNFKDYQHIIDNGRKLIPEMYSYDNVCMHWYNFFSNLDGISNK